MIEKTTFYGIGIFLIIVVGGYLLLDSGESVTGNVVDAQAIQGEMQKVVLSQDGYNYKDVVVEAGKPISLSADNSVGGCLRSVVFNIEGKKYSKYLQSPNDTMELPALKKGTYNFACSMGMGYGKLTAE